MTVARDLQSSIHHVSLLSWAQRLKNFKDIFRILYLFIHSFLEIKTDSAGCRCKATSEPSVPIIIIIIILKSLFI